MRKSAAPYGAFIEEIKNPPDEKPAGKEQLAGG
jgi:hypothetical protein